MDPPVGEGTEVVGKVWGPFVQKRTEGVHMNRTVVQSFAKGTRDRELMSLGTGREVLCGRSCQLGRTTLSLPDDGPGGYSPKRFFR